MTHRRVSRWAATAATLVLAAGCGAGRDLSDNEPGPTSGSPSPATSAPSSSSSAAGTPSSSGGSDQLPTGFGDGPAGHGIGRFYTQDISWRACEGGQCADIWVPLDYNDPNGRAITVKAKRQLARDKSRRKGSLLINPGGPGESGIDYLGFIGLATSVTDVYDVIGFDPRGVASSTPVDCITDWQLDAYVASDPTPDTDAEVRELQDLWHTFTDGCLARSGPLLQHVSTIEVAKDMDVIRSVVGDDKLTYFGASYGTYIGATYASLFPDRVGSMVLDGAVDPLSEPRQNAINQAAGFEVALTSYLKDCVGNGRCPLGDTVGRARQRLTQLFKDIDANPLPTASGREVTEGLAFLGVILPLYSRDTWPYLTTALDQAVHGKGDTLLFFADYYSKRKPDGTYRSNSLEVQSAVNCLDHPENESLQEIESGGSAFTAKAPVFGRSAQWWPYACSNWPLKPTEPRPDFSAKGAAPILVVGTTRDPATPYEQAVKLARELDSGVLLSRDGDGHTAYGVGNSCIDEAINTYLVTGRPPPDGKEC